MRADARALTGHHGLAGVGLVGLVGLVGCLRIEPFACQDDAECVYDGQLGQCAAIPQICLYPDEACDSRWSTAQGECMAPVSEGSTGATTQAPSSTDPDSTGGSIEDSTGSEGSTGSPLDPCAASPGPSQDITDQGEVSASSVFAEGFEPERSVDDDYGTAWFSAGIELDGSPSIYEWSLAEPRCITQVTVIGNAEHDDPMYREGYGYESMVMRVFDAEDAVVFQRMFILAGTPDPDVVAEPMVGGVRVQLELIDHEAFNCGGFSELEIEGY